MGQTLSEPITTKHSARAYSTQFRVGYSSMQGWRVSMEDAHTVLLAVPEDPDAAFFGVFDGHGGASIAEYASKHLSRYIFKQENYNKGNILEAIRKGYLELDAAMRDNEVLRAELAGSTAITVLLKDRKVYCGNAGDSRAIAMVGGQVRALSQDHKPTNKIELERIRDAGGFVDMNRVNGNLALSRALGDFNFKASVRRAAEDQIVTANPDVTVFEASEDWSFIVLACDGIWDVLTNEEVGSFVAERLANDMEPHVICEQLMDRCLAPDGHMGGLGLDNMTVIIVVFMKEDNSRPGTSGKRSPTTGVRQFKHETEPHTSPDETE